jgi:porin
LKQIVLALLALSAPLFAQEPATTGTNTKADIPGAAIYQALTKDGLGFPIDYIGEVLGNPSGGYRRGVIYDGLLEAGITADLGTLMHWQGATFTADMFYPHGDSLTEKYTHDLNVASNIDALHYPRLYELWLQQVSPDGKFSIRLGQIPLDTEFCITGYGTLFMNSAFGSMPSLSLNTSAPVYPVATPGARLIYKPDGNWVFMGAVFDGNTGNLLTANRYGTNYNFNPRNGALWIGEAAYTSYPPAPAPTDGKTTAPTSRPLSGTYKVGAFLNTADFKDNDGGGTLHGDYGVYGVIDQELWHEPGDPSQGLRGFFRTAGVPGDRNYVEFELETGVNYAGLLPGRDKDLTGLGLVYTKTSNGVLSDAGTAAARHYETIIELTYQAIINSNLSVQPDLQYIFNPGGGAASLSNALVIGLRFDWSF